MNKAYLFGNLGLDPESRSTQSGTAVANLSVATSDRYKDKASGEWTERTEWHRVVCWGRTAEIAQEYLRKGSQVLIEGRITTRKWTDNSGQDKYTTEVVCEKLTLVGKKADGQRREAPSEPLGHKPAPEDFDDDIPF